MRRYERARLLSRPVLDRVERGKDFPRNSHADPGAQLEPGANP